MNSFCGKLITAQCRGRTRWKSKNDSSEDDEMECSDSSSSRLTISPRNSSELRVPLDWSVHPDMGRQLSADGEATFQMGSIQSEISRVSYNNIRP
jgi:hypothetical protein